MKYRDFTFIIPAAGKSSRFKYKDSKIFYKYKKKTLIEHILNKIIKFSNKIIIIINKKNQKKLKEICNKYQNFKIKILIQEKQKGMGDAVKIGLTKSKTNSTAVIWADQIFLSTTTINATISKFKFHKPLMCFPVIIKKNPYVYVNFKNNYFSNIIQTREGGKKIKQGYSDCGFFVFNTTKVFEILKELIKHKKILTKRTREIDFLKSFVYLKKHGDIKTIRAKSVKDTIGVNYLKDLK